jgi:hypothetical protein
VVKRGFLDFIEEPCLTGTLITIIDDEWGNPKNLEKTEKVEKNEIGVYLEGRFHEANEKGEVIIPFIGERE